MSLARGDILKRAGAYLTILVLSPCGRYATVARVHGTHIVEEQISVKGLHKGTYNATKHSHRFYQGALVIKR